MANLWFGADPPIACGPDIGIAYGMECGRARGIAKVRGTAMPNEGALPTTDREGNNAACEGGMATAVDEGHGGVHGVFEVFQASSLPARF